MSKSKVLVTTVLVTLLPFLPATAVPDQEMSTASGCGGVCSSATQQTATCAGQAGTTGVSGNGRYTYYAGFLGGAF